jgi:polygalacturonase
MTESDAASSSGGSESIVSSGGSAQGGASGSRGTDGGGGATGTGGSPVLSDGGYPTSCADIGREPTIPAACSTVNATKSVTTGTLTDEAALDTAAIQSAIDACPAGQSVKLAASASKNAFLSGPLTLKAGVTLWIDEGVTLFASRNPRDFDPKPGQCAQSGGGGSCRPLINVAGAAGTGVMGKGAIDGRGGEPLMGDTQTWWDLEKAYAGKLTAPRLVQVSDARAFTLYGVTLRNSGKFHVVIDNTNGFVVWGITIKTPPTSPNTDGVDPSGSTNGVIAYTTISTGDDNVALKGSGPVIDNIIVAHNHFGAGHGMSIGSETYGGVKNVKVCDLSLDGTSNGLRIKSDSSRGGLVQGISYTEVCMRKVSSPLVFDPFYGNATGTQIPDFQDITLKNVHVLGAGSSTFRGYDAMHPLKITLDNVVLDDVKNARIDAGDAEITMGPGPVNLAPTGTNVKVTRNITGNDAPKSCDGAWVTF